ncbi:unnamed protein product [Dovyalis caffra]|uniref:Uncharacterized protein n=1 Tax=Dovyalis caffra TaxID=77055 RepID=A0AAV1SWU1_9ROSI|nr:unnamed protein product [Dovyalis caffra]
MAQASKEPCKKEACDIQACLSKNNFLPNKFEAGLMVKWKFASLQHKRKMEIFSGQIGTTMHYITDELQNYIGQFFPCEWGDCIQGNN